MRYKYRKLFTYLYIIECDSPDKQPFYIGTTSDIIQRMRQIYRRNISVKYLKKYRPVEIVSVQRFREEKMAVRIAEFIDMKRKDYIINPQIFFPQNSTCLTFSSAMNIPYFKEPVSLEHDISNDAILTMIIPKSLFAIEKMYLTGIKDEYKRKYKI